MQTIYLDISNKGTIPTINAKQGEVGRKFLAILTDAGVPYIAKDGTLLSVWYEGASGEGNYSQVGDKSAFEINGNKISIELITQMLTNHGDGIISLVMNSTNGDEIATWNIPYSVEKKPGAESEEATAYYTALSEVAGQASEAAGRAEMLADGFIIDDTLSVSGRSADAKVTGDELKKRPPNYLGNKYKAVVGNGYTTLDSTLTELISEVPTEDSVGGIMYRQFKYTNCKEVGDGDGFLRLYKKGDYGTALFENISGNIRWLRYYNPNTGWGEYQWLKYATASNIDKTITNNSSVFTIDMVLEDTLSGMRDGDRRVLHYVNSEQFLPGMDISLDAVITIYRMDAFNGYADIEQYDTNRGRVYKYRKTCYNGTWSNYEWYEPDMVPGVEYRTTERWNRKPVYRKMVQYTNTAALSGDALTKIPHGVSNMDRSAGVEITTRTQGYQIPYVTITESTAVTGCSATDIELRTTGTTSWSVGRTWYFYLKYTKTTD